MTLSVHRDATVKVPRSRPRKSFKVTVTLLEPLRAAWNDGQPTVKKILRYTGSHDHSSGE